jgi:hypothetical protein
MGVLCSILYGKRDDKSFSFRLMRVSESEWKRCNACACCRSRSEVVGNDSRIGIRGRPPQQHSVLEFDDLRQKSMDLRSAQACDTGKQHLLLLWEYSPICLMY